MHIIQEAIGLPKMNSVSKGNSIMVFMIAPLPSGFGHTLGNAVRRVLLSSLPGAAIVAIKVQGASHEYATLTGVKDSVMDIILNLKKVKFKKHSSETEIVSLQKKGEGAVTAKDIKTSSDIEILNPDEVITYLDGKNTSISIDIKIEKGVGYLPVKNRLQEENDSEWILTDAAFSPVLSVQYEVHPHRVGERTNLDKLEITVETDDSLSPEEAIKFSATLLQGYFSIFEKTVDEEVEPDFISDFNKIVEEEEKEEEEELKSYTPIEVLNLSPRTLNALINGGIGSIEELTACTLGKLSTLRGFGKKAQEEVLKALEERSLSLADE